MTSVTTVRTPRLLMRGWQEADREPFAALNADPEVMEYFPATLTREESDAFADRIAAQLEEQDHGLWALEVKATGEFIGYAGLANPSFEASFTPCTEVGWRLARDAWGHGYATEAARAALRVGFGKLGLAEVVSFTAVGNARSRAVMARLGMSHDPAEDFDHPSLPAGHPLRRHVLYRLTRQEWSGPSSAIR
jgi:RimJ/RimL family protein N-acetyltransferase